MIIQLYVITEPMQRMIMIIVVFMFENFVLFEWQINLILDLTFLYIYYKIFKYKQ